MGHLIIRRADGTEIVFSDDQGQLGELMEFCDLCNEPKPISKLDKYVDPTGTLELTWVCYRCTTVNQRDNVNKAP